MKTPVLIFGVALCAALAGYWHGVSTVPRPQVLQITHLSSCEKD